MTNGLRTPYERNIPIQMVLKQDKQQRLSERLKNLADFGGIARVAELAGVTTRVIQKARDGENVHVETMELITQGLLKAEAEKEEKLNQINQALT